nr:site-specific DNA-methyltransferase [Nocardioides soli]
MLTPPPGTRQVSVYVKPPDAGTRGAFAQVRRDLEAIYFTGTHGAGIGGRSGAFRTNASNVGGNAGLAAKAGGHPHTKPQDVMQELILLTSGVVADPFSGGGSTLVAAKQLGRRIIGIELEERYCEIAAKRLSQDSLFGDLVRVSSTGATS